MRTVEALPADGRDTVFWDSRLPGFGVRVYPSGVKAYIVQSRGPLGSKRLTLCRHGDLPLQCARERAAAAIRRIKAGENPPAVPPPPSLTIAELAVRYMRGHVAVHCKPASAALYRRLLNAHILPVLGALAVRTIDRPDIEALHRALRDTPATANSVLVVLTGMFTRAEAWGFRPPGENPCRLVRKFRTARRERFLSASEFRRLGRVLTAARQHGTVWESAVAALHLLMLTGCRRNEILTLRWDDVDWSAGEIRLRDTKTGTRMIPLTPTVAGVLRALRRQAGNPWVITGKCPGEHLRDLNSCWRRLRERAGLRDVRLHDLRHSWASRALALGESLPMIGALLGHTQMQTTARYAHLERGAERRSGARVAASIAARLPPPRPVPGHEERFHPRV